MRTSLSDHRAPAPGGSDAHGAETGPLAVGRLLDRLRSDPTLVERLETVHSPGEFLTLAREAGYAVTARDLDDYARERTRTCGEGTGTCQGFEEIHE